MEVDLARLGRFVADNFDLDQLQALCQELNVPYDQLLGASRSARAFDLVTIMHERGQSSALLAALARARPDAFEPRDFEAGDQRERAGRRGVGCLTLLGGGVMLALLVGSFFLLTPRATPTLSPSPTATMPPARSPVATMSSPSPSPTALTATPSFIPPSPTAAPTARPSPSATRPSATRPSATSTATSSPTPSPTTMPTLSPLSPALIYDTEARILWLTPGDTSLGRGRLCTPLNAYHGIQAIYFLESTADSLTLPLPGKARVVHTYPERLANGTIVRILEVRRHPLEGVKVSGEAVDFTGCDLLVSEQLRELLDFPLTLGEFDDPPRFDHGWVSIEFLTAP